jgi:hypothetical protein
MKLVNTTKFDRKSGVAQWRDLRFLSSSHTDSEGLGSRFASRAMQCHFFLNLPQASRLLGMTNLRLVPNL